MNKISDLSLIGKGGERERQEGGGSRGGSVETADSFGAPGGKK